MIESDIKTEVRWLLEGHDLKGNDKYYVRITEQKLYEEYQKAIDALTIDPVNRLQKKIEKLEIKKSQIDMLTEVVEEKTDKIANLEDTLKSLLQTLVSKGVLEPTPKAQTK